MRASDATLWALQEMYRANPEDLEGAPTNEEIIASSEDLKKWPKLLTDGERAGFLQQWKMGHLRSLMSTLGSVELQELRNEITMDIQAIRHYPNELQELRVLQGLAATAIATTANLREE